MPNYPEWQCPDRETPDKEKLGWLNAGVEEGQAWHRQQRSYRDYKDAIDIICGVSRELRPKYRSMVTSHRLKTNIRVSIAGLANIRPLWGYHSEAKAYQRMGEMLNKLNRALYLEGHWGEDVKSVLQWQAATACAFMRPVYSRGQGGWGKGSIRLMTYGLPSVLPVQMPANGDWQEAYAVHLMDEMPIWQAHAKFPDFQDKLNPTQSKYWYSADIRGAARANAERQWWNPFRRRKDEVLADLYVPIRYTTVNDLALNLTGKTVAMGEPGSPWYYEVPPYDPSGNVTGKKISADEARLYPYRRLLISSEEVMLYDGPSFNWHGQLDLIDFALDKWPFEPTGFSAVHDGFQIQRALDDLDRGIMDRVMAQQDIPLAYNLEAVTKREAEQFDPMQPRGRVGYDGSATDKPFSSPVPPEIYQVSPESLAMRKELQADLDYILQSRDIVELGKARALGKGMDQLEALLSANGPIVKDMAASMETSLCKVGHQLMYLELEYLPTARVIQYVGEDGVTPETFDYDPAKLVPSHMPDENPHDSNQNPLPSRYPAMVRARHLADNVKFFLLPHSIHELTQMTHRLMLLQLRQRGLPISAATIMESCNVADVGKPEGVTEQDRYYSEMEEQLQHQVRVAEIMKFLGIEHGLANGSPGGMPPPAPGGGKPNGSGPKGGRPPSGQQPPQLEQKGDGRPVVSESG